jgi:branched-chain amino acid transport system substrate-binding protein
VVQEARDEIASWPPRGTPIRIIYDSVVQGDPPDVEVARAQRLVAVPGLVGVVGHGGSRGSLVAAPVYNEAGIPQITPTSTSRLLRGAGDWTFNLAPSDSAEGAFIADYASRRLAARRVTLFYTNDEYGVGLRQGVVSELGRLGVTVLDQVSCEPSSDFETLVAAALQRGVPDVVIVAARQVETARIAQLVHARHPRVSYLVGDGALIVPELAEQAGPAAGRLHVATFWLPDAPDSVSQAFVRRFQATNGSTPHATEALGRDALILLATAVREVGPRPERIRQYLADLGRTRPPFVGVTGEITFQPDRPPRLVMARFVNGLPVRVSDQ